MIIADKTEAVLLVLRQAPEFFPFEYEEGKF